jgi:hypothetical protein
MSVLLRGIVLALLPWKRASKAVFHYNRLFFLNHGSRRFVVVVVVGICFVMCVCCEQSCALKWLAEPSSHLCDILIVDIESGPCLDEDMSAPPPEFLAGLFKLYIIYYYTRPLTHWRLSLSNIAEKSLRMMSGRLAPGII